MDLSGGRILYIAGGPDLCASLTSDNGHYWSPRRYRDIFNHTDDFHTKSVGGIFGPGFTEELPSFARANFRSLSDNLSDPFLIR
jgi:hypothetical protein